MLDYTKMKTLEEYLENPEFKEEYDKRKEDMDEYCRIAFFCIEEGKPNEFIFLDTDDIEF